MPNPFFENRDAWIRMCEVDYVGQFTKAWLAFNAWYRNISTETQDRVIIENLKWHPNSVRNKLSPLLVNENTAEAENLRSEIGRLHERLEAYELHEGKGDVKRRITLTDAFLKKNGAEVREFDYYARCFRLERSNNGNVSARVTRHDTGGIVFDLAPTAHNVATLEAAPQYVAGLTGNLRARLRQEYMALPPDLRANLLAGPEEPVTCGPFEFYCGRENLFAGVLEVIYLMRCTLFHGELVPNKDAVACYEPAYRLVRQYLECATA